MECRKGCGACCIAISISSPIPGMPGGKPAGVKCLHLTENYECGLFNDPSRPKICQQFQAEKSICGDNRQEALQNLKALENLDHV